jgi:hypothetical protein
MPNTNMNNTVVNPTNVSCTKCGGYIVPPTYWHSTLPPKMCNCYIQNTGSTGWLCPRCGSSNAPTKMTCGCAPQPLTVT